MSKEPEVKESEPIPAPPEGATADREQDHEAGGVSNPEEQQDAEAFEAADSNPGTANPGTAEELTAGEVEQLKAKAAKAQENWDRFLRLTADFDNFKKRTNRDRLDAIKYANEAILERLIPVLDNFEMAQSAASAADEKSVESLRTGVSMIQAQLRNVLSESGLEEVDATNQPFDPNWHEAVSQQETDEVPEGHVVRQLRKGYKLRDRLVRPATVIVAKKPAEEMQ